MANPDQDGIKWWKHCDVCLWAARTTGAPNDNEREFCPNCNNPALSVRIDKNVFEGRRYDLPVQSSKGQAIADEARVNAGQPPAPVDTEDNSNQGHNYGNEDKPFPPPP